MHYSIGPIACISLTLALSGCNETIADFAGQTPPGGTATATPTAIQSTPTLTDTGDTTSVLAGVAAYYGKPTLAFMETSGTLTHKTGATTLRDDNVTLNDADGVGQTGNVKVLSDATSRLLINDTNFAGSYDYVRPYTTSYDIGSTKEVIKGVYGISTTTAQMPTSGSASYTGDANVDVAVVGAQYTMIGKSKVDANFATGKVDVVGNGFTAFVVGGGSTPTSASPVDEIKVTGMTVTGSRFSGGLATTSKNGAVVDIRGAGPKDQAAGVFYGYDDANAIPDEVGGIVNITGASGQVHMIFLAD